MALRSLAGRAAVVFRLRCATTPSLAFSSQSPFSTAVVLDDLKYAKTHEWVRVEGDCGVVGITHHAQEELGDVVFVDLPEVGRQVAKGESFGVVESVKAASDIYSPISGEVVAVNSELADSPALVNKGPFDEGWIMKVKLKDHEEVYSLLDAEKYEQLLEQDEMQNVQQLVRPSLLNSCEGTIVKCFLHDGDKLKIVVDSSTEQMVRRSRHEL